MHLVNWILSKWTITSCVVVFSILSCSDSTPESTIVDDFNLKITPQLTQGLPIYGNFDINDQGDTVFHTIPNWKFKNQNGLMVSDSSREKKVYIADFFFSTCPSICPIMTKNLVRAQQAMKSDSISFVSYTVNPEFDTDSVLLAYANKMNAELRNWDFLTGDRQTIYRLATHYLVVANHDPTQEIEFVHSDQLILIDQQKRIRGMYTGMDSASVDQLIKDAKWLIQH